MLLDYFTRGTGRTITGSHIGMEIETDFVDSITGQPITEDTSRALSRALIIAPEGVEVQRELGRQKVELAIAPQQSIEQLIDKAFVSLTWLYEVASRFGATAVFAPELNTAEGLLMPDDPRDRLWLRLDGVQALEELCRCSSVQFTIDVNPHEAIEALNALHRQQLHLADYEPNHRRWLRYMELSHAGYKADRYGGPSQFDSLSDYVAKLKQHRVVMHQGRLITAKTHEVPNLDIDLYLRSVWWHYRLRRYHKTLAIEIRPFARRRDEHMIDSWNLVATALGLTSIPVATRPRYARPRALADRFATPAR